MGGRGFALVTVMTVSLFQVCNSHELATKFIVQCVIFSSLVLYILNNILKVHSYSFYNFKIL